MVAEDVRNIASLQRPENNMEIEYKIEINGQTSHEGGIVDKYNVTFRIPKTTASQVALWKYKPSNG